MSASPEAWGRGRSSRRRARRSPRRWGAARVGGAGGLGLRSLPRGVLGRRRDVLQRPVGDHLGPRIDVVRERARSRQVEGERDVGLVAKLPAQVLEQVLLGVARLDVNDGARQRAAGARGRHAPVGCRSVVRPAAVAWSLRGVVHARVGRGSGLGRGHTVVRRDGVVAVSAIERAAQHHGGTEREGAEGAGKPGERRAAGFRIRDSVRGRDSFDLTCLVMRDSWSADDE